jgi:hypothetical protein
MDDMKAAEETQASYLQSNRMLHLHQKYIFSSGPAGASASTCRWSVSPVSELLVVGTVATTKPKAKPKADPEAQPEADSDRKILIRLERFKGFYVENRDLGAMGLW